MWTQKKRHLTRRRTSNLDDLVQGRLVFWHQDTQRGGPRTYAYQKQKMDPFWDAYALIRCNQCKTYWLFKHIIRSVIRDSVNAEWVGYSFTKMPIRRYTWQKLEALFVEERARTNRLRKKNRKQSGKKTKTKPANAGKGTCPACSKKPVLFYRPRNKRPTASFKGGKLRTLKQRGARSSFVREFFHRKIDDCSPAYCVIRCGNCQSDWILHCRVSVIWGDCSQSWQGYKTHAPLSGPFDWYRLEKEFGALKEDYRRLRKGLPQKSAGRKKTEAIVPPKQPPAWGNVAYRLMSGGTLYRKREGGDHLYAFYSGGRFYILVFAERFSRFWLVDFKSERLPHIAAHRLEWLFASFSEVTYFSADLPDSVMAGCRAKIGLQVWLKRRLYRFLLPIGLAGLWREIRFEKVYGRRQAGKLRPFLITSGGHFHYGESKETLATEGSSLMHFLTQGDAKAVEIRLKYSDPVKLIQRNGIFITSPEATWEDYVLAGFLTRNQAMEFLAKGLLFGSVSETEDYSLVALDHFIDEFIPVGKEPEFPSDVDVLSGVPLPRKYRKVFQVHRFVYRLFKKM